MFSFMLLSFTSGAAAGAQINGNDTEPKGSHAQYIKLNNSHDRNAGDDEVSQLDRKRNGKGSLNDKC